MQRQLSATSNDNSMLRIVCPTQKRAPPIFLCCIGLAILLTGAEIHLSRASKSTPYFFLEAAVVMGVCFVTILYRNLFWCDEICIWRNKALQGICMFDLAAEDICSIRRCHSPDPWSSGGQMQWLGFGSGCIEIRTESQFLRFGVGLSEHLVDETIDLLRSYSSRPIARQVITAQAK
jgi:hypothetical protein